MIGRHSQWPEEVRLILYHKQATSARTRFLRFAEDTVCGLGALPPLSSVMERSEAPQAGVRLHPAALLQAASARLGLPESSLAWDADFYSLVNTPSGAVTVYLARFTTIDPPFAHAEACGARFIDLTEARDLGSVELELLRQAYCTIMEG